MSKLYEHAGRDMHSRQQRLAASAAHIGLSLTTKPSHDAAAALTDFAWVRDGTPVAEAAAARARLPWVLSGRYRQRDTVIHMVDGAPGAIVAARTLANGPVIRLWSRFALTTWTYALGMAAYLVLGAAAAVFLSSRGYATGSLLLWVVFAAIGGCGVRHVLGLLRVVRLPKPRGTFSIGDGGFRRDWSVACDAPGHAGAVLSTEVRRVVERSDPIGASWWKIGNGWVCMCVRYEPVNRTHGRVLTETALRSMVECVVSMAEELDDAVVGLPRPAIAAQSAAELSRPGLSLGFGRAPGLVG